MTQPEQAVEAVTVPRRPTEAMLRAMYENRFPPNSSPAGGFTRWATWEEARVVEIEPLTKGYAAMLDAAPPPPAAGRVTREEIARVIKDAAVPYRNGSGNKCWSIKDDDFQRLIALTTEEGTP